jgi:hypothetical protein
MKARALDRSWQRVASIGLVSLGLGVGSAVISNEHPAGAPRAATDS